jgi:hypothetical protein
MKYPQVAVYWGNPQNDGYGGHTFDTATEIRVRWEDKQELFRDVEGREVLSSAVVYSEVDLDLGGFLYLGNVDDSGLDSDPLPKEVPAAREIKQFSKIPNLRGTKFVRKSWL